MARGQETMKAIREAIARLETERAAINARIDGHIAGLREAEKLHAGGLVAQPIEEASQRRSRRGNLKDTVLDLAMQVGDRGLTAEEAVRMAKTEKGIDLIQNSVSSLLSRLKQDDVMFYDGQRYRLKQYAGPRHAA